MALFATSNMGLETVSRALWKLVEIAFDAVVAMPDTDVFSDDHDLPSSSTVDGVEPASFVDAPFRSRPD